MKLKRKHYILGTLVILLLAAPLFYWHCLRAVQLRISPETTFVTEPLTACGTRIDYFRALENLLYPPEMKTDDNGFRMVLQSFGLGHHLRIESYSEALKRQFYEKLGLDYDAPPTHVITPAEAVLGNEGRTPWTLDTWPEAAPQLADWLETNQAGLDRLAEAVRKPVFQFPFVREEENGASFTHDVHNLHLSAHYFYHFSSAIQARANFRVGIGNIDGAIEDAITLFRLGRHVGNTRSLNHFTGHGIEGEARAIRIAENPDHPPTKEQLAYFLKELNKLPPPVTWQSTAEYDRLYNLGRLQELFDSPVEDGDDFGYGLVFLSWTISVFDANAMFIAVNRFFDAVVALDTMDEVGLAYFETQHLRSRNPFRYLTTRSRSEQVAYEVVNPLEFSGLPASILRGFRRNECASRLHHLTIALLLYEAEHGNLPDGDWRLAITPYLSEVGEDYFRCPSQGTGYALVLADEQTPDTILLVEAPLENISAIGTIANDPALFAQAHFRPTDRSFHEMFFRSVSFRNGTARSERTTPLRFVDDGFNQPRVDTSPTIDEMITRIEFLETPIPAGKFRLYGKTVGNENFDWESLRGKYVLVKFTATWCAPCHLQTPAMLEIYEQFRNKEFEIVSVHIWERGAIAATTVRNFVEERGIPWIVISEPLTTMAVQPAQSETFRELIQGVPTMLLVDKEGNVISRNARAANTNLRQELARLLGE